MNATQQIDSLFQDLGRFYSPRTVIDIDCEVIEEPAAEAPRLQMKMSRQPEVIICSEILEAAATHIKENADDMGYFKGEFGKEFQGTVINFDIDCRLFYDGKRCSGVKFYGIPEAHCYDADGIDVRTDFTAEELAYYIKG